MLVFYQFFCNIFMSDEFSNLVFLEYVQLQDYQSILHFQHSHTKLSSEFLLIHTHEDLLCMPHPFFGKLFLK